MQKEFNMKWKLGLFVTLTLILLIAVLFFLGKQRNLFGSVFHVKAVFGDVSGLKVGNNVRFGGIDIGTVDGIRIVNDTSVMVDMVLQQDVQKFIRQDAFASIGSEGLMGDKVVVISPGTGNDRMAGDNAILSSRAPVETDQILASLKTSADNAAVITQQLAEISYKINKGHGVISRLIGDTALSNNLDKTIVNLRKGSKGLSENMEAAKHNFLLKGYFRKKQREEEKKKEEQEKQEKAGDK